jgi:hypothetical protein
MVRVGVRVRVRVGVKERVKVRVRVWVRVRIRVRVCPNSFHFILQPFSFELPIHKMPLIFISISLLVFCSLFQKLMTSVVV